MSNTFWQFDWSWWRLAAGVLALGLTVWLSAWNVRRARINGRIGRRMMLLETLRALVVALLAFTLLKPERVRQAERVEKPLVAVLCDMSGSMATQDVATETGGLAKVESREEWLKRQRVREFWKPLALKNRVTLSDFAAPPVGVEDPATDLNAALEEAMKRAGSGLRAVVLLSDGDWNRGTSPVTAATRLRLRGVPLYPVVAGSDQYLPDIDLQSVMAPAYGLMDEHISIPFTVQSRMPREVRTTAVLEGPGGEILAKKEIVLPAQGQVSSALVLVPKQEGSFRFKLKIPVEPGEMLAENNVREFQMALRREKLKVLVVESLPRWEYRYLRNALARDPGIDVSCLLLHPGMEPGDGPHYLRNFPATRDELSKYDVVFLGDIGLGAGGITEEQAKQIKGLVEQQGSGLVFLPGVLGRQVELMRTELAGLMPVVLDADREKGTGQRAESKLRLTTAARDHLLTILAANAEENEAVWRGLPGFYWYAGVVKSKPGADVLAVHAEARNENGAIPLLVTREAGNGKVLFMGTDGAWRWRRGVEDVYHYRFWGQVVRWMAHQRHLAYGDGIRFFHTPENPVAGERIYLHATVFGSGGTPVDGAAVTVEAVDEKKRTETVELAADAGGWGTFSGTFTPRSGGKFEVTVRCRETGKKVTSVVTVSAPKTEKTGRPARADVLKELADTTGGRCGTYQELDKIVDEVRALPEQKPEPERFRLWCHPLWGALIVLLLGAYWVGRKLLGKL